ncbi:MAG: 2-oxoacid:acceptor oxidoreductase subunit alpha [Thermodesulfobacteriota bacterium]
MGVDVSIRIGGQAGQGMQSISFIMGKIFTRHGYYVFINQDVESRIRGGHNFNQVRVQEEPVHAISDEVNLLIALDKGTIDQDLSDLIEGGVLIFDGPTTGFTSDNPNHFSMPLEKLATQAGKSKIMVNSVATGAALALLGYDLQSLLVRLEEEFVAKGKEIVANNRESASAGYRYVQENYKGVYPYRIPPTPLKRKKMLLTGSQAMALGAICSGLKFYSGYPMSPSTPIMEFIASISEEYDIILEPAEDEIAAMNMVIGASFGGARAMTATSGGGFCLMVEGLGLAGMTETPIVVVVVQRPGPATGLPTRTEQADLRFTIHAAHGEFPRAVFAPGYPEQAFYTMGKAFNMAERYQTPVIILGDQHFNDSYFTVDELDGRQIRIDRGDIVSGDKIPSVEGYKRYAWGESGISPRILPGQSAAVSYVDSDEHTETGHITESSEVRKRMVLKRMRKLDGISREMGPPEMYPSNDADVVLLGWGSTYGAMKEAVHFMNREGLRAKMLHFSEIYPLPARNFFKKTLKDGKIFAVENNYSGQFADLFSFETGIPISQKILKYDGRPFSPQEIIAQVKEKM